MNHATVAQIEAEARRFQIEVGERFSVTPNSYGIRVECLTCFEAACRDRAYSFGREHKHEVPAEQYLDRYPEITMDMTTSALLAEIARLEQLRGARPLDRFDGARLLFVTQELQHRGAIKTYRKEEVEG